MTDKNISLLNLPTKPFFGHADIYLGEIDRQYNTTHESFYTTNEISAIEVNTNPGFFVYSYDCSGLFDLALRNVLPQVYNHFADVIGPIDKRLTTDEVANFFKMIGASDPYWTLVAKKRSKIENIENIINAIPGDVLLYRKSTGSGHLMTVKDNLGYNIKSHNTEVLLQVYDSALSRHSGPATSRNPDRTKYHGKNFSRGDTSNSGLTGLGFGTIGIKTDMASYRWRGTETVSSPLQSVASMYLARLIGGRTVLVHRELENPAV